MENKTVKHNPDANPDPITGEPGAHPVGTGLGAAGLGAAGTAVGAAVAGPVGVVVGAVLGSVLGGLAGKSIAESVDPTLEEQYWRDNYRSREYVKPDYDYDEYAGAYRTGYEGYVSYADQGLTYDQVEPRLKERYEKERGTSRLDWDSDAKYATRDAWERVDQKVKGRRDNDEYWRKNYQSRPYAETNHDYDYYAPAFWMGYESYSAYGRDRGMTYEEAEPHIRSEYESHYRDKDKEPVWDKAKDAIKDAWHRAEETFSNDDSRRVRRT